MRNENNNLQWRIYLSGCIILVLKLFLIDIDTPPWAIAQYSPIDEYYYAINAYNFFEQGNLFGVDKPILFGNPLLTNVFTYFSLKLFGDNYLGLRFTSFLFGFLSYSMIFGLLKRAKIHTYALSSLLVFIIFNFTFANASYIVEPSILRICSALVSIYILIIWKEKKKRNPIGIVGVTTCIGSLLLFSYPTNAFVLLASYLVLVVDREWFKRQFFTKTIIKQICIRSLYFGLGIGLSLVLYYAFSKAMGLDLLDDSMNRSSKYSNRLALSVKDIVKYIWFSIRANIFVLNPLFLLVSLVTLLNIRLSKIKMWSSLKYTTFVFLVAFFLQSLFINDFPERKLILFFPFLCILIAFYIDEQLKTKESKIVTVSKKQVIFIGGFVLLAGGVYYKYSHIEPISWVILFLGIGLLMLNKRLLKLQNQAFYLLMFCLTLLPELIHSLNYHIVNRTYAHKNLELSLKGYEDSHFIGGYSMGFRGYNTIQTSVNPYYYYDQDDLYIETVNHLRKNGRKDYSIDYRTNSDKMDKMGFRPSKSLKRLEDGREWVIYEENTVE